MRILATIYAVIALVACSAFSAMVMYTALRLFDLADFVADMLYSIKVAAVELWRTIVRE